MIASENAEMTDLVDRVWQSMGGVGSQPDVTRHVLAALPEHLTTYLVARGVISAVGAYFRRRGETGLPTAPLVDKRGTHMQLELMSVEEYRFVVVQYLKRGRANYAMAQRMAEQCQLVHGVQIDLDYIAESA